MTAISSWSSLNLGYPSEWVVWAQLSPPLLWGMTEAVFFLMVAILIAQDTQSKVSVNLGKWAKFLWVLTFYIYSAVWKPALTDKLNLAAKVWHFRSYHIFSRMADFHYRLIYKTTKKKLFIKYLNILLIPESNLELKVLNALSIVKRSGVCR